jgi:SAM-dependent methyltransferase
MHDSDHPDAAEISAGRLPSSPSDRRPKPGRTAAMLSAALLTAGLAATVCLHQVARRTCAAIDGSPPSRPAVNAPFITTPQDVVDKMVELASVGKGDLLYDLGCGDGRIAIAAAKTYGCRAIGYDIDPERVGESRQNVIDSGVEDLVTIERADVFTLDLRPANRITMYLLPLMIVKLIPQLEQLPPGSRIVSHDFEMQGVTPDERIDMMSEDGREHSLYLWTTPLKRE